MVLNNDDSSFVRLHAVEAIHNVESEWLRPSVIYRPQLSLDGNRWCALYGDDLQEGVAGFGDSPEEAMKQFDREWGKKLIE